jgi:hypothetical protein
VAGIAALVRSVSPKLTNLSVNYIIKESANQSGWNSELGWGLVDAGAAVALAKSFTADTRSPVTKARGRRSRNSGRIFKLRWRSKDLAPPGVSPSGVLAYKVYAKRSGSYKFVGETTDSFLRFRGSPGKKYSFYVQAQDRAGNVEAPPGSADFVVRVRR